MQRDFLLDVVSPFALAGSPAVLACAAAKCFIDQEIFTVCDGQGRRINPASKVELDLTGKGWGGRAGIGGRCFVIEHKSEGKIRRRIACTLAGSQIRGDPNSFLQSTRGKQRVNERRFGVTKRGPAANVVKIGAAQANGEPS